MAIAGPCVSTMEKLCSWITTSPEPATFYYTQHTIRDILDVWPALPLVVQGIMSDSSGLRPSSTENVIAALMVQTLGAVPGALFINLLVFVKWGSSPMIGDIVLTQIGHILFPTSDMLFSELGFLHLHGRILSGEYFNARRLCAR